jgi:hypothetical protein
MGQSSRFREGCQSPVRWSIWWGKATDKPRRSFAVSGGSRGRSPHRKKDMLLVNGINVYPREIEEIIYQFPDGKEAAVVGVPDAPPATYPLIIL